MPFDLFLRLPPLCYRVIAPLLIYLPLVLLASCRSYIAPVETQAPAPLPVAEPLTATPSLPVGDVLPFPPIQYPPIADEIGDFFTYFEHLQGMQPADIAREIGQWRDASDESALHQLQFSVALAQTRQPVDTARALATVQRVIANSSTQAKRMHPLAKLLESRLLQQRRLEDQLDRQAQQLRDAQRKIEQLTERLEAMRAIERSLTARPTAPAVPTSSARPSIDGR